VDIAGGVKALPDLPLVDTAPEIESIRNVSVATGTDGILQAHARLSQLVPNLVPTTGKLSILGSTLDKVTAEVGDIASNGTVAVSAYAVKRKDPLTRAVNGSCSVERRRVELPTSALRTQRSPN
jgi:hypothetical protein